MPNTGDRGIFRRIAEAAPVRRVSDATYARRYFPGDAQRQEVFRRIRDWFPKEVLSRTDTYEYTDKKTGKRIKRFKRNVGKANRKRLRSNIRSMDELDLELILGMDREQYRQMASVNRLYWYH